MSAKMTRRVQRRQGPIGTAKDVAVRKASVRREVQVQTFSLHWQAGCEPRHEGIAAVGCAAVGVNAGASCGRQPPGQGRMVQVGVRDDDLPDMLARTHGSEDRGQMSIIVRSWVDHDKIGRTDNPGVRAGSGQRRRVRSAKQSDRGIGGHGEAWLSKQVWGG